MREIQASEASITLPSLLDEVERSETFVITRHGRPIARIVPEHGAERRDVGRLLSEIEAFRKTMPSIPLDDLLASRHGNHRY